MIARLRLPVPATFLVVVSGVIFLIIFFGAWAVSADVGDKSRTLSFGFVSGATTTNATALNSSEAGLLGEGENGAEASDSWWGGAFLRACPFH